MPTVGGLIFRQQSCRGQSVHLGVSRNGKHRDWPRPGIGEPTLHDSQYPSIKLPSGNPRGKGEVQSVDLARGEELKEPVESGFSLPGTGL